MRLIIAIAVVAFSLGAEAQTAKVIQLTHAEATEARSLYEQKKAIEAKMENFKREIQNAHLIDPSSPTTTTFGSTFRNWIPGWNGEFEYSEDFKFIVPVEIKYGTPNTTFNGFYGCNNVTPTLLSPLGTLNGGSIKY